MLFYKRIELNVASQTPDCFRQLSCDCDLSVSCTAVLHSIHLFIYEKYTNTFKYAPNPDPFYA